jgi:hypothetical protein
LPSALPWDIDAHGMRLRRRNPTPIRPEHAEFCVDVARTLRDATQLHAALPVGRDALLEQARLGAMAGRERALYGDEALAAGLPEHLRPLAALRALERVTCSLVAHAQSPPDSTGALRPGELTTLIGDDLREWQAFMLRHDAPGDGE